MSIKRMLFERLFFWFLFIAGLSFFIYGFVGFVVIPRADGSVFLMALGMVPLIYCVCVANYLFERWSTTVNWGGRMWFLRKVLKL